MKKNRLFVLISFCFLCGFSNLSAEEGIHSAPLDMFFQKCTKCHDAAQAQRIHDSGKKPIEVIKEMQKKKGANISDHEAADIAGYLEAPFWQQTLLQSKCVKCHPMDVIINVFAKDPAKQPITKETIKLMQQKGADITDRQVDDIYEIFKKKPYIK